MKKYNIDLIKDYEVIDLDTPKGYNPPKDIIIIDMNDVKGEKN